VTFRVVLLYLALLAPACAGAPPQVRSVWLPTYAFGAIGGGDLDLRDVCAAAGAAELSVGSSWGTLAVSFITLGVYTPREAKVRCRATR
jgi:Flp pilus assembly protein protease CpaA